MCWILFELQSREDICNCFAKTHIYPRLLRTPSFSVKNAKNALLKVSLEVGFRLYRLVCNMCSISLDADFAHDRNQPATYDGEEERGVQGCVEGEVLDVGVADAYCGHRLVECLGRELKVYYGG